MKKIYMKFFLPVLFAVAGLLLSLPDARPQAVETVPPALKEYKGRRIATTMHWKGADWLIRKQREREEASSLMLQQLDLKPGQVVCDLGCGNGYHTLRMARQVAPGGKIYAVDVQQEMLNRDIDPQRKRFTARPRNGCSILQHRPFVALVIHAIAPLGVDQ